MQFMKTILLADYFEVHSRGITLSEELARNKQLEQACSLIQAEAHTNDQATRFPIREFEGIMTGLQKINALKPPPKFNFDEAYSKTGVICSLVTPSGECWT